MQHSSPTLPIILTGDRTTGPLHLGHYVGSLKNRVTLQTTHQQYLLLADARALTDNAHNPGRVRDNAGLLFERLVTVEGPTRAERELGLQHARNRPSPPRRVTKSQMQRPRLKG
jgi:hypothetical protein